MLWPRQGAGEAARHYDGNLAWVNSAYASLFIEGHGGGPGAPGAEEDASFDCAILPSLPNDCISVIYRGDGIVLRDDCSEFGTTTGAGALACPNSLLVSLL